MIIIIRDYKFLDDFSFVMSVGLSVRLREKNWFSLERFS
jgi:hypothetical protein